ncbi:hydrogen peroxide-inducible genes activator [Coralliovum pocilloporae]|uniref:hydrogen peroxide-inducible genes activator n=1 Tax=Coralliovum pocilloporae TaxID=3066369 RepID=UPI0033076C85
MVVLPSLRQLQYFSVLSETRSFSVAAEKCGVTQSTLSAGIRQLEQVLGGSVVDRSHRDLPLTRLGEAALGRIRSILVDAEALTRLTMLNEGPLTGPLKLGVIPSIAPFLLPRALPALRARYPRLQLVLQEDLTRNLLRDLRGGQLDAALLAFPHSIDGLDDYQVLRDRFYFAAPSGHRLLTNGSVSPRDLADEPLLLLEDGHCLRDHVLDAVGRDHANVLSDIRASSLLMVVQMVDGGLGTTVLPQIAVDSGVLKGTGLDVTPVDGPAAFRDIRLVWRKRSHRSEDYKLLAEGLTEWQIRT